MDKQEWLYNMRPQNVPIDYIPWENLEDTSFTKAIR